MIIDKNFGRWRNDTTSLEDVVYMLYLEDYKNYHEEYDTMLSQGFVIYFLKDREKYFKKANVLCRKEKLNKLNNL